MKQSLSKSTVHNDPVKQFGKWYLEASDSNITDPNAMTIATATSNGLPSARIVLLKEYSHAGFMFYTNYLSRKGRHLEENPYAALLFFWPELERQIRIEGMVEKVLPAVSEKYFNSRPRESQLGAWASQQSHLIENRKYLEQKYNEYKLRFIDNQIPRPEHWGGYLLKPSLFEFWQGRTSRLHDRIEYTFESGSWQIARLAP